MNTFLAKLLGVKGAWKFIVDLLVFMSQAQKLDIPGLEKLDEVIVKLRLRYSSKSGVWTKLLPLIKAASKAIKELYVGVCEAFETAK